MKKISSILVITLCLSMLSACADMGEIKVSDLEFGEHMEGTTTPVDATDTQPQEETTPTVNVEELELDRNNLEFGNLGQSATIYSGEDAQQIHWYSEDSSVAGVCAGVVTAVGPGTTTIHCVAGDKDLTCSVNCTGSFGSAREPLMEAPKYETVASTFFDDAVFVGDSISLKLSQDESGRLGNAIFLVQGSYGVGNAVGDVLPTIFRGQTYTDLEDAIAATGGKKLFIMLGMNDIALYGIDKTIENWGTLLGLIRDACPGIEIYIQSMTPVWSGGEKGSLTNPNINAYNNKLRVFAAENDCVFIDVAPFMRDSTGGLATAYCSDQYVHVSEAGVDTWIKVLLAHAYE